MHRPSRSRSLIGRLRITVADMAEHANIGLVRRIEVAIGARDILAAAEAINGDVVWHQLSPRMPDLESDKVDIEGRGAFLRRASQVNHRNFQATAGIGEARLMYGRWLYAFLRRLLA